ncbi:hypothetical protein FPSE_11273, partial [Fusarium pseudograminearum CS3096]
NNKNKGIIFTSYLLPLDYR